MNPTEIAKATTLVWKELSTTSESSLDWFRFSNQLIYTFIPTLIRVYPVHGHLETALEVGARNGDRSRWLADMSGARVLAIDKEFRSTVEHPLVSYKRAGAESMPFLQDDEFDIAIGNGILSGIKGGTVEEVFSECMRVSKYGVIFSEQSAREHFSKIQSISYRDYYIDVPNNFGMEWGLIAVRKNEPAGT